MSRLARPSLPFTPSLPAPLGSQAPLAHGVPSTCWVWLLVSISLTSLPRAPLYPPHLHLSSRPRRALCSPATL